MSTTICPTPEKLKGYLTSPDPIDRGELERHLSACRSCRRQLVDLYRATRASAPSLKRAPRLLKAVALRLPRGLPWPWRLWQGGLRHRTLVAQLAAAMAAVMIGGAVLWNPGGFRPAPGGEVLREQLGSHARPAILKPLPGSRTGPGPVEFRWSSVADASHYTFTLLDAKGDIIAEQTTPEIGLSLDLAAPSASSGETLYWYVRARLSDGTVLESSMGHFVR